MILLADNEQGRTRMISEGVCVWGGGGGGGGGGCRFDQNYPNYFMYSERKA